MLDTERTDDTTPLLPTITAPTQTNYDFLGWSLDNPNEVDNPELALIYDSSTMTYTTTLMKIMSLHYMLFLQFMNLILYLKIKMIQ